MQEKLKSKLSSIAVSDILHQLFFTNTIKVFGFKLLSVQVCKDVFVSSILDLVQGLDSDLGLAFLGLDSVSQRSGSVSQGSGSVSEGSGSVTQGSGYVSMGSRS